MNSRELDNSIRNNDAYPNRYNNVCGRSSCRNVGKQMSDGEVKRWILENHGGELFYSPIIDTYEEVVSSTDHERVVAELKATIDSWIESHDARVATIAKQAKVIEVLKACILKEDKRCGIWHEGRKAIEQAESIERGEA